ncbi:MAG: HEAT repeat domain-containing protein [Anaerolineae bacterium]|nr:HEAT repeat domain-containing protein [Anaerolineae bacterium]
MSKETYPTIQALLSSNEASKLAQGLKMVRQEIAHLEQQEAEMLFDLVVPLFYIDPLDLPDFVPILNEAVSLVAEFGAWVIPILVEDLDAGDVKAQLAIGHALGRLGADAIPPLLDEYAASEDLARRTFILYALGKIKSPQISQVLPLALEAASGSNLELRDTATRALGKFAESIPAGQISEAERLACLERLRENLGDPSPAIRAKAIRSWGKLARYGHLTEEERQDLKVVCQRLLGTDEHYQWDRAYMVRHEAKEALQHV